MSDLHCQLHVVIFHAFHMMCRLIWHQSAQASKSKNLVTDTEINGKLILHPCADLPVLYRHIGRDCSSVQGLSVCSEDKLDSGADFE